MFIQLDKVEVFVPPWVNGSDCTFRRYYCSLLFWFYFFFLSDLITPSNTCCIHFPRMTNYEEQIKITTPYLNKLIFTSNRGLQSSKLDKTVKITGKIKFRKVIVNDGEKLNTVFKRLFISAACCWNF